MTGVGGSHDGDYERNMNKYWMVGLGGFAGSIARFWLGAYISNRLERASLTERS